MYIVLYKVSQVAEQAKMSKKMHWMNQVGKVSTQNHVEKYNTALLKNTIEKCTPVSIGNPGKISIYIEIRPPC